MAAEYDDIPNEESASWRSFIEGDEAAFEQIFTRYYPILFQYGRKFSSDTDFIKDAIQDLFAELWQRRTFLSHTPSVKNYLYKSLRRKMLRLAGNQPRNDELTEQVNEFTVTLSPEQLLLNDEFSVQQREQMANWLSLLTPRQREAIYLRFYHDLGYDEIAAIMTISNHASRNLIYEALKFLRIRLLTIIIGLLSIFE